MNEFYRVSICIDDDANYDDYYFSSHEKAVEFAKPFAKDFIKKCKWENIADEIIEDLEKYDSLADLIYIEKITVDDGKSY